MSSAVPILTELTFTKDIILTDPTKKNGYGRFVDPMPYFEKEELPETSKPGWAEIICDGGANMGLTSRSRSTQASRDRVGLFCFCSRNLKAKVRVLLRYGPSYRLNGIIAVAEEVIHGM